MLRSERSEIGLYSYYQEAIPFGSFQFIWNSSCFKENVEYKISLKLKAKIANYSAGIQDVLPDDQSDSDDDDAVDMDAVAMEAVK